MEVRKMKEKKLTMKDIEKVTGGAFTFDTEYEIRIINANLECPACHATGTLNSVGHIWEGYSDGRKVAVDHMICSNCGAFVALFPEQQQMCLVDKMGEFQDEMFPAVF